MPTGQGPDASADGIILSGTATDGASMGFRGLVLGNREGPLMLARDDQSSSPSQLKRTPLHALHVARGGKMVPFAGYEMPVQFPAGILKEHLHTRASAGLFDVSHMGQAFLSGGDPARALERLTPADVIGLKEGMQRYGLLLTEQGTIKDDFMFSKLAGEDALHLVVNA